MKRDRGLEPMDEKAKKRIEGLSALPESEIDTAEIKEWTEEDFARSVPFHGLYKPRKEQLTMRIDADVLAWLKSHGKGYQTLMNELLRKVMMEERKRPA